MKIFIKMMVAVFLLNPVMSRAQDGPSALAAPPAEKYAIGPGDVDMRTGQYVHKVTDISAGPGDASSLTLTRSLEYEVVGHINAFGNFAHNWDIMLTQKRIDLHNGHYEDGSGTDYQISVHYGGRSQTFRSYADQGYSLVSKAGWAGLIYTGDRNAGTAIYTYTASDGTQILFRSAGNHDCSSLILCASASSVVLPDGSKFTFAYETQASGTNRARLKSVTSSRGYALLFEYGGSNWNLATKTCILNLSQAVIPGSGSCPATAPGTVSYTYTSFAGDRLSTVTDVAGKTWSYSYSTVGSSLAMAFTKPGASSPWLTNYIGTQYNADGVPQEIVGSQSLADGRTYTYAYDYPPDVDGVPAIATGGTVTDNLNRTTVIRYNFPVMPGSGPAAACPPAQPCPYVYYGDVQYQQTTDPATIVDALGRTTVNSFCDPNVLTNSPPYRGCLVVLLQSTTDPEGGKTKFSWDYLNQNVTQVRKIAKPGSGLPDIVTSATYDCTYRVSCAKPTSVTDANGKVTTYTYDTTHGGMLTMTRPGVAVNGTGTPVAPVKRYGYTLRKAWVSNGSGGYVQNSDGVYLLTSEKMCRATVTNLASGSCAGGAADEVVTNYDYGPDSGPNNLLLRGMTVTADIGGTITTLRTCYGYDVLGNRISETKPRANLSVCP